MADAYECDWCDTVCRHNELVADASYNHFTIFGPQETSYRFCPGCWDLFRDIISEHVQEGDSPVGSKEFVCTCCNTFHDEYPMHVDMRDRRDETPTALYGYNVCASCWKELRGAVEDNPPSTDLKIGVTTDPNVGNNTVLGSAFGSLRVLFERLERQFERR